MFRKHSSTILILLIAFAMGTNAQNYQWLNSAGGEGFDEGLGLTIDNNGNSFITGQIEFAADFGNGVVVNSYGIHDIFLAKYNDAGTLQWAINNGSHGGDKGYGVAVDQAGNIYVAGEFEDTAFFDNESVIAFGSNSMFIAKYSPTGQAIWVRRAGAVTASTRGYSLGLDASDNIYVAGGFQYDADFDGTVLHNEGEYDIFIAKYDPNGNLTWVKNIGGSGKDRAYGISFSGTNRFYVAGEFSDDVEFNSGTTLHSYGATDIFLAKFNLSGDCLWAVQAGDTADDVANSVMLDQNTGNILIAGEFKYHGDFGSTTLYSAGNEDMFVASYTSQGVLNWARRGGGVEDDIARSVDVDPNGNVYVAGDFADQADFSGTQKTSNGFADFFIASYTSAGSLRYVKTGGGNSNDRGRAIAVRGVDEIFLAGDYKESMTLNTTSVTCDSLSDIFITYVADQPSSGIEIISGIPSLPIYPNPVSSISKCVIPFSSKETQVKIYNCLGEEIQNYSATDKTIYINNSDFPPGVFWMEISADKKYRAQFVISK